MSADDFRSLYLYTQKWTGDVTHAHVASNEGAGAVRALAWFGRERFRNDLHLWRKPHVAIEIVALPFTL